MKPQPLDESGERQNQTLMKPFQGLTFKQLAIAHFYRCLARYEKAKDNAKENPREFVFASLALHSAKGDVPRHVARLANQAAPAPVSTASANPNETQLTK